MDQPSWMQSSDVGVTSAADTNRGTTAERVTGGSENAVFIRTFFHFMNIGVSVMMAASAAFGFIDHSSLQEILLSLYLMIFAVLLFMYELVRVLVRCESAHQLMLKNFGFFFGAKGRGLYLIFVGFLNLPLTSQLSEWTAYVTLGWGVITVLCYMSRPEWFESPKPAQTVVT